MQQSGKDVKRTLGQKTEDRLMKYILDKPVKIGERIPTEGELTELFEVGRSTVREAVKRAGHKRRAGSAQRRRNLCHQYHLYGK